MVSRTDPSFVADRLLLASRDNMGGLRIKEPQVHAKSTDLTVVVKEAGKT